jgi:Pyruvate/2-oxoacid:ferredoxin oxidoreductase gamma subunit
MADEMNLQADAGELGSPDEDAASADRVSSGEEQPTEGRLTDVAVIRADDADVAPWRKAALAVRAAAPQLIRNPVVVGASAAVATIALRVAIEAAQRALGGSAARPHSVAVTGSILHDVRVVRHVHVIHHVVHHYPYRHPLYGSQPPRP